ncbi:MAG: phage portal protein [Methylomicrobium sp.]|nr:phage portal protein [Methylomicrobium sp.]
MDQDKLVTLIRKRHPEYNDLLPHWRFLESCYKGGRGWFEDNIFRYIKEGELEYSGRIDRAYRFNHSREVVDLVDKYLFKSPIIRNDGDASDEVNLFWEKSTKFGLNIDQYMKQISRKASIFGSAWVVVDNTYSVDEEEGSAISVADIKDSGGKIFSYLVTPDRVLDFAYDEDGELLWVLIYEQIRDSNDPFDSSGDMVDRYRLWTKMEWYLFSTTVRGASFTNVSTSATNAASDIVVTLEDSGQHNLGVVPAFRVDNYVTDETWAAPSLIGDIAYLDRAVANYLSNLDVIIQDQTFSQLIMPAQGLMPGDDGYKKLVEMGTKRIFLYDGERDGKPEYISPDPKQANVIMGVITKIINEIYHTVGMAGERTKQDNAVGIDNSSGVAKAFDFERVNSLLTSKAASLEVAERKLVKLVNLWAGNSEFDDTLVRYARTFDIRSLFDEFDISARLSLIEAPDLVRREQMNVMIDKLFPMLNSDVKEKMRSELQSWPPKMEEVSVGPSLLTPKVKENGANGERSEDDKNAA